MQAVSDDIECAHEWGAITKHPDQLPERRLSVRMPGDPGEVAEDDQPPTCTRERHVQQPKVVVVPPRVEQSGLAMWLVEDKVKDDDGCFAALECVCSPGHDLAVETGVLDK